MSSQSLPYDVYLYPKKYKQIQNIQINLDGDIIFRNFQGYLDCPADECECSQTIFDTVYCCSCINMTRLPEGVVNCPNNCIAYCARLESFHCCLCDGDAVPRPPPTTTTTTTAAPSGGGGGCFPSTARVSLENGESVTMSELQAGDRVQTGTDVLFMYTFRIVKQKLVSKIFRITYSKKFKSKNLQGHSRFLQIHKQYIFKRLDI